MTTPAATNSFAEQQLVKYGWKKGQGLGKNREGVKRAITVSQRTDNRGIGSDSSQWNSNWWDHLYNKASGSSSTANTPQTTLSEDNEEEENDYQTKVALAENERDTLDDYQGLFVRAVSTSVSATVKTSASLPKQSDKRGTRVDRTQFVRDSSIHLGSTGITDAELFAACEGRMARKGARAEQNGKLARVLGDGMPRPEVAARIEAALAGRLHELEEATDKKKRKRADDDGDRKEKKKKESKSKDKEKSRDKKREYRTMAQPPPSLASFEPEYSADCLEFSPFAPKQRFLVGTYQLVESAETEASSKNAQRVGRIHVCDAIGESGTATMSIAERQRIETSAIFDIKWSYNTVSGKELVGVACASGALSMYTSSSNETEPGLLSHVCEAQDPKDMANTTMCCSLDWSNRLVSEDRPRIATSQSDGSVRMLEFAESQLVTQQRWQAHDLEAWIAAFDYWTPSVVYSGGDDARLKAWDIRMDPAGCSPIFSSRRHEAGVCSIQSSIHRQFVLATGSYDENVLIWDTRSMRKPLAEHSVGGGAWRLKWHPQNPSLLLVAAMYNGFHVLDVAAGSIRHCTSFMDHTSIAYGADWCQERGGEGDDGWLVGTCSFYDRIVHLWRHKDPLPGSA
ncbi:hypothetical protein EV175_000166 [Coemansia sp. RSA 1933]|nr:hypothetical protein EV175_000166 [Coemansia sp. RSA 1933]